MAKLMLRLPQQLLQIVLQITKLMLRLPQQLLQIVLQLTQITTITTKLMLMVMLIVAIPAGWKKLRGMTRLLSTPRQIVL